MGPKTSLLCARLEETILLLERADEIPWAVWLKESLRSIEKGDISGIEHLLAAYGGMGSFNDLLIHPANGHRGNDVERAEMNERLAILRSELYDLGEFIRHNSEIRRASRS